MFRVAVSGRAPRPPRRFRVKGLGFRLMVDDLGFRVWSAGLWVCIPVSARDQGFMV